MSLAPPDYAAIVRNTMERRRLRESQMPVHIRAGTFVTVLDDSYVCLGYDSLERAVRTSERSRDFRRQYIELLPDGTWRQVDRNGDPVGAQP